MAQFQVYNYQFRQIVNNGNRKDLFGYIPVYMSAEEAFSKKQELFRRKKETPEHS